MNLANTIILQRIILVSGRVNFKKANPNSFPIRCGKILPRTNMWQNQGSPIRAHFQVAFLSS